MSKKARVAKRRRRAVKAEYRTGIWKENGRLHPDEYQEIGLCWWCCGEGLAYDSAGGKDLCNECLGTGKL